MPQWRKAKRMPEMDGRIRGDRISYRRLCRGLAQPDKAFVYGLFEPDSLEVRYIGKTHMEPRQRLHLHIHGARMGDQTGKAEWIRAILSSGRRPLLIVLDCVAYKDWPSAEQRWVEAARDAGFAILNSQGAGGGA